MFVSHIFGQRKGLSVPACSPCCETSAYLANGINIKWGTGQGKILNAPVVWKIDAFPLGVIEGRIFRSLGTTQMETPPGIKKIFPLQAGLSNQLIKRKYHEENTQLNL